MNDPKFIKRKKSDTKKAIILLIILGIVIIIWNYLDEIMELIFQ